VVGTEVLPEALAPLLEALPRLEIEVVLSNSNADLLRHEADLAIRMVRPTQGSLVARRVGKALIGLFARRDYLERHGTPVAVTDLPAHILIGSDRDPTFLAGIEQLGGPLTRRDFRLRCDSEVAQIAALRQGLGIAFCQAGVASRDLNLVPVLREQIRFALDCWLVTHEDLRLLQRVRLVADHLARDLPKLFDRRSSEEQ
jgi:DNA-binding transcriptional LysR family regulator